VVHGEDGTDDRHVTPSKGDRINLKDLAEAAEHGCDAGGVDVLGLETGGRDERAHARATGDAVEGFLWEEVDASV
jgi:hypothetical protein